MVRVDGVGVAPPVSRRWRARAQIAVLSRTHRRRVATRVATQLVKEMLARDAAAHRAMLIVGRFFTGRRARQRTACFGTKGLALLNNANIASTDRPACLIASAAYCRVSYSTGLASIASHGALIARLQSAPAKPQSRAVLRRVSAFEPWSDACLDDSGQPMLPKKMAARAMQF